MAGRTRTWFVAGMLAVALTPGSAAAVELGTPQVLAEGLVRPWEVVPLGDGRLLLTELPGRLRLWNPETGLDPTPAYTDAASFLGLVRHPNFAVNRFVYLYATVRRPDGSFFNRITRLRESGGSFEFSRTVVGELPGESNHDGGRMGFGPDGFLYVLTGDIHRPLLPRDPTSLAGKVLRMRASGDDLDGTPAPLAPFAGSPLVWSVGHRNPQGLAFDHDGRMFITEHGPSGESYAGGRCCRDEINFIDRGLDYGWPTYSGDDKGTGTRGPVAHSGNAVAWAPSGAAFAPDGRLYTATLLGRHLREITLHGTKVMAQRELLQGVFGRLRTVVMDGSSLLLTTSNAARNSDRIDKLIRIPFTLVPGPPGAEPGPSIRVDDWWMLEGGEGTRVARPSVRMSAPAAGPVTVKVSTADATAIAPSDYDPVPPTTLTFAPGEVEKVVPVTTRGDTTREATEAFKLSAAVTSGNAVMGDAIGTVSLATEEGPSHLGVSDARVLEGQDGESPELAFRVSLQAPLEPGEVVTVAYASVPGTAGADDVSPVSGRLTFAADGPATQSINVPVKGDAQIEGDETVSMKLSGATGGAVLADGAGTGTVVDDDGSPGTPGKPYLTVTDVDVLEGDEGRRTATTQVRLSMPSPSTVSVTLAATPVTAFAPTDFTSAAPTSVTFAPGETVRDVPVSINGDVAAEGTETFTLRLSAARNAVIADAAATVTITDEEGPIWVRVSDTSTLEGRTGTAQARFTVELSALPAPGDSVSVTARTADGTSSAPSDYTAVPTDALGFTSAGPLSRTMTVPVVDDAFVEGAESFSLALSSPRGVTVADTAGRGVIVDDD